MLVEKFLWIHWNHMGNVSFYSYDNQPFADPSVHDLGEFWHTKEAISILTRLRTCIDIPIIKIRRSHYHVILSYDGITHTCVTWPLYWNWPWWRGGNVQRHWQFGSHVCNIIAKLDVFRFFYALHSRVINRCTWCIKLSFRGVTKLTCCVRSIMVILLERMGRLSYMHSWCPGDARGQESRVTVLTHRCVLE